MDRPTSSAIPPPIRSDDSIEALRGKPPITDLLYNLLCRNLSERDAEQMRFRDRLYKMYKVQPKPKGEVWCPITKSWGPAASRRAAHIVPYKIGYSNMDRLFYGNGYELMWAEGNGLIINECLEQAYDRFEFCLLPVVEKGKPDEFKLMLIDESLRHTYPVDGRTYDDLDGQTLEFRPDSTFRPEKRFLYFHYFMCLLKSQREFIVGWKDLKKKSESGKLWAAPGPYLRSSLMKKLAASIGDYLEEGPMTVENVFEADISADEVDVAVREILAVLAPEEIPDDDLELEIDGMGIED